MLVRIFPGKPQPCGVTQIGKNGLDQDVRKKLKKTPESGKTSHALG